jgi:hypothetical protein
VDCKNHSCIKSRPHVPAGFTTNVRIPQSKPAAGYSGTSLAKKLGIKAGIEVLVVNGPADYRKLVEPLPEDVRLARRLSAATDLVHVFVTRKAELASLLERYRARLKSDAVVWVSWPKKSARPQAEITDNTVREVALPLGFVDVKVCAVDDTWSGLKLVVRKELR